MPNRQKPLSERLAPDRPTRGADKNDALLDHADPSTDAQLFPDLKPGINLLEIDGGRGVAVLQSLVLDHVLTAEGPTFWVDANGYATTTTMARLAPSQRLLDQIHVARGFTAYQHYSLCSSLSNAVSDVIQRAASTGTTLSDISREGSSDPGALTPALIVAPAVDANYRNTDSLSEEHGKTLQARALARLSTYAEGYDIPVLLTRTTDDGFSSAVERAADRVIKCKETRMGPRFSTEDFETLVYPVEDGTYYQTTFAYWRQVLDARVSHLGIETSSKSETDDVGRASLVGGESAAMSTDPLTDAWIAGPGGR